MIQYLWHRIFRSLRILAELRKTLILGEFDVLHWLDNPEMIITLGFGLISCSRGHLRSTKWFLNIHPGDLSFKEGGQHFLRKLYKGFSGWALRMLIRTGLITGLFVHGTWIRDQLVSTFPNNQQLGSKLIVAPYGVESLVPFSPKPQGKARQVLNLPEGEFVILSFGMIRREKCIDDIIRATSLVPNAILVLAGRPTDIKLEEIQQWIVSAGIENRTLLRLEYIPEKEIGLLFAAADVMVLAHNKHFAGQSGPLHLACYYLTPVIVSDVGDIGRFVHETGIGEVFPAGDWEKLAEVLVHFQKMDKTGYQRYTQRERQVKKILSWDTTVNCYVKAYRN
jgi:glycosyltransferase involved in cell wall biosynthesis